MAVAVPGRRLLASRRPELSRLITCVIDNELLGLAEGISGRLIPCQRSAPAIVVALDPRGRLAVFDLEPELFSQLPRPGAARINPWEPGHGHPAGSVPGMAPLQVISAGKRYPQGIVPTESTWQVLVGLGCSWSGM